jgi:hypothetical protein
MSRILRRKSKKVFSLRVSGGPENIAKKEPKNTTVRCPLPSKISLDDVKENNGEYRNIAIHLLKKWTSICNSQIGELFGGLSYSAVSKTNQRFSAKLETDRKLKKR